jgi:NADH-quinone oxidoreductase subunit A
MGSTEHLISYSANYVPILAFIVLAFLFGAGSLLISHFVQPKLPDPEKLSVYECGSEPFSDARMPFPVRYYIIAMLFVIFDIEIVFLYPWAVAFDKIGMIGMVEMVIFIALFVVGYVYAWKKGALDWD